VPPPAPYSSSKLRIIIALSCPRKGGTDKEPLQKQLVRSVRHRSGSGVLTEAVTEVLQVGHDMLRPLKTGRGHNSQGGNSCSTVHVPSPAAALDLSKDAVRARHSFLQQLHDQEFALLTVNGIDEQPSQIQPGGCRRPRSAPDEDELPPRSVVVERLRRSHPLDKPTGTPLKRRVAGN